MFLAILSLFFIIVAIVGAVTKRKRLMVIAVGLAFLTMAYESFFVLHNYLTGTVVLVALAVGFVAHKTGLLKNK